MWYHDVVAMGTWTIAGFEETGSIILLESINCFTISSVTRAFLYHLNRSHCISWQVIADGGEKWEREKGLTAWND
jgi:hypothetical protein